MISFARAALNEREREAVNLHSAEFGFTSFGSGPRMNDISCDVQLFFISDIYRLVSLIFVWGVGI